MVGVCDVTCDTEGVNSTINIDALSKFASAGERLDPRLREEVLALGAVAVPQLTRLVEDEELWADDGPGGGWPPIHAVELLAELKASQAIPAMLDALCETGWDDIIHDRLVQHLPKLGPAVLEPALGRLTTDTPESVRHAICCVVANLGVRDPRAYVELCRFFAEDEVLGSSCLADYGDPAALPLIVEAIEEFEPDFDSAFGVMGLADLIDAHERLGSAVPPQLREHADRLFSEFEERRRPMTGPAPTKVGRNETCPCGSGVKFKKCCMGKAKNDTPNGRHFGRSIRRGGQEFLISKGITPAALAAVEELVEAKRRGQGPAQQMADFAKPLLDAAQDEAALQNAMNLGVLFWNLAVCRDEKTRAGMLDDIVKTKNIADANEFRALAAEMVDRHKQMFPNLHPR